MRIEQDTRGPRHGLGLFAKLVVGATFILLLAGGNVTSKGAGLAVPDWPLSFGSFNPQGWTRIPLVRDEHSHRLIGATVGLLVTVLAVWLWKSEPRSRVRRLGYLALLAVVVQGVMGGLRVTELSLSLAIIHGCFAQAFFCLVIVLAMMTSPNWTVAAGRYPQVRALRRWTFGLLVAIYLQLVLGAVLRHTGIGHVAFWHIGGALVVGVCLMQAAGYVFAEPTDDRLTRPMIALFLIYALQLIIGVVTYLLLMGMETRAPQSPWQAYLPTLHVALGALILGTACYLAVRVAAATSMTTANTQMTEAYA